MEVLNSKTEGKLMLKTSETPNKPAVEAVDLFSEPKAPTQKKPPNTGMRKKKDKTQKVARIMRRMMKWQILLKMTRNGMRLVAKLP